MKLALALYYVLGIVLLMLLLELTSYSNYATIWGCIILINIPIVMCVLHTRFADVFETDIFGSEAIEKLTERNNLLLRELEWVRSYNHKKYCLFYSQASRRPEVCTFALSTADVQNQQDILRIAAAHGIPNPKIDAIQLVLAERGVAIQMDTEIPNDPRVFHDDKMCIAEKEDLLRAIESIIENKRYAAPTSN